jgi:hypothetical protein
LFVLPTPVFAAAQLTEIMYDVSGSDSGREWVEFTNTGSDPLDASGYKFFEANTNHALTLLSGTGVLVPGASALIIEDQTKFMADNPNFSGTLFKSSFSLSNTGESLGLKDSALDVLDSVTYDSSMGAGGDGNSLQRSGSGFVAGVPTPGSYGGGAISNSSQDSGDSQSDQTSSSTQQVQVSVTSAGGPAAISAGIEADAESMVGGGEFFTGEAFSSTGAVLSGARFIWNFGDGTTGEGARVFHTYDYPGQYEVVLSIGYNYSSATTRLSVSAVPAQVSLIAEGDGSLTINNNSTDDLDVGLWSLVQGSSTPFVIPENTLVMRGHGVRFSTAVLGFSGGTTATLKYPDGALAASAGVGKQSPLRGQSVVLEAGLERPVTVTTLKAPMQKTTAAAATSNQGAAAVTSPAAKEVAWTYLVGLVAVIALGAVGAYYAGTKPKAAELDETESEADEFEIE